jgi:glycosyltransferase involved in cell wall biosynthesis
VRRPSVGVLLGTFLYPALGSWLRLAQSFEETIAFKTPVSRLVVLNDGTLGDRVAQALSVRPERFRFWMHGVDQRACAGAARDTENIRGELDLPQNVPLIASASRLAGWKRIDRIIRAMPHVLRDHPDAVLAVSGSGPVGEELKRLVGGLGLAKSVRFTGPLPREANLRLIAAADIFCSFHDFSNVGVSLLEALTCGVAVVVTDVGATREFVEHGVNGFVVKSGDPRAAADAISSLLNDAELRQRLAAEGARRAHERFLTKQERRQLELELIEELVQAPRR